MDTIREELLAAKEIILQKEEIDRQIETIASRKKEHEDRLDEMDSVIAKARKDMEVKLFRSMKSGPVFTTIGLIFTTAAFFIIKSILAAPQTPDKYTNIVIILMIALPPLIIGLLLLFTFFRNKKRSAALYADTVREKEAYRFSTVKPAIDRCDREMHDLERSIQYLKARNETALAILPEELQDSASIDDILNNLETGKAESLAGAMNLCAMAKEISSLKRELEAAYKQLDAAGETIEKLKKSGGSSNGPDVVGGIINAIFDSFGK